MRISKPIIYGFVCRLNPVQGWAAGGHVAIARVTLEILKEDTQTRAFLRDVMGVQDEELKDAFFDASVWADDAKRTPAYKWSTTLHFANTPRQVCGAFDYKRDCSNDLCVVSAVARYTAEVANPMLSDARRLEALKFLIHFVGDLHNPMHLGFREDLGGSLLDVYVQGQTVSLHEVWDVDVIQVARTHSKDGFVVPRFNKDRARDEFLLPLTAHDLSDNDILRQMAADMATQVIMTYTCPLAYKHETNEDIKMGDIISGEYLQDRSRHAVELIKMAGVRLAQILEVVTESYNSRTIYAHSQGRRVPKTAQDEADEANGWEIAGQPKLKRSPKSFALLSKSPLSFSNSPSSSGSSSSSGHASPMRFSSSPAVRASSAASSPGGIAVGGALMRLNGSNSHNTEESERSSPVGFVSPISYSGRSTPLIPRVGNISPSPFEGPVGRKLSNFSSAPAGSIDSITHVLPISHDISPASSNIAVINKPVPVKFHKSIKLERFRQ